jgi:glycosyltransferase involved in cell wall biosynthesis
MKERRILMIINYFPPSGGGGVYRPLSFVKYLSRLSWNVTVVTPRAGEFWISDPGLEREVPTSVRVVRTASLSGSRLLQRLRRGKGGAGARRSSGTFMALRRLGELLCVPDSYVGWVPFATKAAAELCRKERFDILYSTSPPDSSHVAAGRVARAFGIPWVADFRDPWINLYLRDPPTPLHRTLQERMERKVSRADVLLVTTAAHEQLLRNKYPGSRVERIPNGYDEEDFSHGGDTPLSSGPLILAHCGMLTLGRTSKAFLEGLRVLAERSFEVAREVRVVFIGPRESANESWAKRLGLASSVSFEGNLPHRDVIRRERESHVLLLIKHDDPRYNGLVPGKLYEYIGARRPILAVAPDGEAADIVRGLGRGEVARADDPLGIAVAIEKMYHLHRAGMLESSYQLEEKAAYSRRVQAEKLSEVLSRLIGETC